MDGGFTGVEDLPPGFDLHVTSLRLEDLHVSANWLRVGNRQGRVQVLMPTIPGAAVSVKLHLQSEKPA